MARFFLEPEYWSGDASLQGDEAHHCARVMRAAVGDRIEVFDGRGRFAEAEILALSKKRVTLKLGEPQRESEPLPRIVLGAAVIKGRAMDWLIQKAVELGVSELVPVVTERSIARRDNPNWQRTVLEACKQCGRSRLPELKPAMGLSGFLSGRGANDTALRLIASLSAGAKPLRDYLVPSPRPLEICFLVGPEGDFTHSEMEAAVAAGFQPFTLGKRILRSETASLSCLSASQVIFTK